MKKVFSFVKTAWVDSRPAVYAVVAAVVLSTWSLVNANGFPKTSADWAAVGWAAVAAASAAAARAVDPYVGRFVVAGVKAAFGNGVVVNEADIQKIVQSELVKVQLEAAGRAQTAAKAAESDSPAPVASAPTPTSTQPESAVQA